MKVLLQTTSREHFHKAVATANAWGFKFVRRHSGKVVEISGRGTTVLRALLRDWTSSLTVDLSTGQALKERKALLAILEKETDFVGYIRFQKNGRARLRLYRKELDHEDGPGLLVHEVSSEDWRKLAGGGTLRVHQGEGDRRTWKVQFN
ncbi:MAG: hypothetical protein QXI02_04080 [Candidatus Caldarchaeum sp.]